MSVLVVTSLGDIVVDLHTDRCPLTTKNFLKLCKMKYYNGCLFHKVEKDFMAQTGDRTGTGSGGDSVYKFLYGDQARFFDDEIHPDLKHTKMGTVAMATAGKNCNASQFYFTLRDNIDYLDGKHTVFGVVEEQEGLDTLIKINEAFVDDKGRPLKNIRIKHTYILDDPFADPQQLADFIPEKSPEGKPNDETAQERLEDDWVPLEDTLGAAELEKVLREKEAHTNAAILEGIGDIPDADIKPPDNVLFVCKLNPVTQDEDLHTIFSRFGNVISADIIRDYKTGDSLCYAFIEFENKEACEMAYFKMDNTLIDDRRIHVDFSQSVSKLWSQYRHGKRNQNKGSGCYKCGALDHIAKDCDKVSVNKEKATKYVLKEGDSQHGSSHQRYDLLFGDEDGDDDETRVTKKNNVATPSSEGRQKDHERNYRHRHDQGRAEKENDRRHASRSGEVRHKHRVYERNKGAIDIDSELRKQHERIRPGRGEGESKRGSVSDHLIKDEKKWTEHHRKETADCQTSGHRRDGQNYEKRNENDNISIDSDNLPRDGRGKHHRESVRRQHESSKCAVDDSVWKHEGDHRRSGRSNHHSIRHERGDDVCGNKKRNHDDHNDKERVFKAERRR